MVQGQIFFKEGGWGGGGGGGWDFSYLIISN